MSTRHFVIGFFRKTEVFVTNTTGTNAEQNCFFAEDTISVLIMDDNKRKSPIISLEKLLQKEHEFVSLEDALQDVVPPEWSADVLNGKKRVVIDCPEPEELGELEKTIAENQFFERVAAYVSSLSEPITGSPKSEINICSTVAIVNRQETPNMRNRNIEKT